MATIKSYTDVEQSKKLAEILPLESADMRYDEYTSHIDGTPKVGYKEGITEGIPCWSLAALFNVLSKNINIGRPALNSNYKGYYWVQYYDEFMEPTKHKTKCYNNSIDACYDMILKLHELNLL